MEGELAKEFEKFMQTEEMQREVLKEAELEMLEANEARKKYLAQQIETLSPNIKRQIRPLIHHTLMQQTLFSILTESTLEGSFDDKMHHPRSQAVIERVKNILTNSLGKDVEKELQYKWKDSNTRMLIEKGPERMEPPEEYDFMKEYLITVEEFRKDGNRLYKEKNYGEALNTYHRGINILHTMKLPEDEEELRKHNESMIIMHRNRAAAALHVDRLDIAIDSCEEVLKLDPRDEKALFRKAKVRWRQGRSEEAKSALTVVLEVNPENEEAKQLLNRIEVEEEASLELAKKMVENNAKAAKKSESKKTGQVKAAKKVENANPKSESK